MKIKPRRSRKYANYGAIPKNEYQYGTGNPTVEPLLSPTEGTDREKKIIANHTSPKLPVKIWIQQFRQNRTGKQKPSGTFLGWRTNRTARRSADSDKNR